MKKNTSFVYYVIPFFICAIVTVVIIVHLISFQRLSVTYEQSISQESNSIMQNPFRGFYKINGYMLSDKTNKKELTKQIKQNCKANSYPLVLLEINLKNYANTDISSSAQQQLDTILTQYTSASNVFWQKNRSFSVFCMTGMVRHSSRNLQIFSELKIISSNCPLL